MMSSSKGVPIVVDLDHTLVKTDFLYESFLLFIKQNPLNALLVLYWLMTGNRASMKNRIAERVDIKATTIPFNEPLIAWLKEEKLEGRKIVLATASNLKYARAIANHLGIFDDVYATHSNQNLKGSNKARYLIDQFGESGFDYAGDSHADLKIWEVAHKAILVNPSPSLEEKARAVAKIDRQFNSSHSPGFQIYLRAIRTHQWLKNLLLFIPLLTSHHFTYSHSIIQAVLAFIAFSLCASSVYILNDFLDLQADREHPEKSRRPFAAGELSIPTGLVMMAACLLSSVAIASSLSGQFLLVLLLYLLITTSYSFLLKHLLILDIITLAGLYTYRVYAGAVAINVDLSYWLLSFSVFIFLSLAVLKRYTELLRLEKTQGSKRKTRAYVVEDLPILRNLGTASGYISVLVMALYINSPDVLVLYTHSTLLWLVCPALLFWVSRVWILAQRDQVDYDPILFVAKDIASRWTVLAIICIFVLAT